MGAPSAEEVAERVRAAEASLQAGDVVIAKQSLRELFADAGSYDEATRDRLLELLHAADRRMQFMPREDISLQHARIALAEGDLRRVDMHAGEVSRSSRASTEQRIAASDLMDEAARLRVELEPMIPAALDQAVRDFIAGNFAESKAGFDSVRRSGVALSSQQESTLEGYSKQIVELEQKNGRPFEAEYVPMGVLRGTAAPVAVQAAAVVTPVAMQDGDLPPGGGGSGDPFRDAERVDAQRLLAEAEAAFEAGRYAEAQGKLEQLNTVYRGSLSNTEVEKVSSLLRQSRAFLAREGGGLVDRELDLIEIQRQQVTAEIDELLRRAQEALDAGDVGEARRASSEARLRLRNGRDQNLFSEPEFERRSDEIDELFLNIESTSEALSRREAEMLAEELLSEREKREREIQQEKVARINENLDRIRVLQSERRYEDALQVVDEILFLDPNNPTALLMKDILRDIVLYTSYDEVRRTRDIRIAEEMLEGERGMIIPDSIIDYPEDWPEISVRRGEVEAFTETPVDRRVLSQLETQTIPANFDENRLEDVLTFVQSVTNLNIDVDWDSLSRIGIRKDDLVSLELRQVSVRTLLDRILQKVSFDDIDRADWAVQDGIVVVASAADLKKNTFIVVYDIRDLTFQLRDAGAPPSIDLSSIGQGEGGGGGGGGGGLFEDEEDEEDDLPSTGEQIEQLLDIIQTNIDPNGWELTGGTPGIVREFAGNLVITNTARNHRQIQGLLRQLRQVRNLQISLESRFLQVSEDFFEQIGINLDLYFNGTNNQVDSVQNQLNFVGADQIIPDTTALYPSDVVFRPDSPNQGTATILLPNADGVLAPTQSTFVIPSPNGLSVIPVEQNSLQTTTSLLEGSAFAQAVLANNPALATAFTFLDDVQVDFLLEATQADRRNVSLSSPRLTLTNGNSALIRVGTEQSYIQEVTPIVGPSSVAFAPQPGVAEDGFLFWAQGVVSSDRRYVTLNIRFQIARIVDFANEPVFGAAGGGGDNPGEPNQASVNIQLPIVSRTSIDSAVTVPDRGTILLGGQRLNTEVEVESGVPVLSKIPILNRFFSNRATVKEQSTLLLLLKPTILIQDELEDQAFPGLRDRLDAGLGF
ncbi:MAG: hypothetical protein ACTS3F_09575 [Phycisphaerales bacterium]